MNQPDVRLPVFKTTKSTPVDALLWELLAEGSPDDQVEVLIKAADLEKLPTDIIDVVAQIGDIASCRIRRGDIISIRENDAVLSMKAQRVLFLDPPLDEHYFSVPNDSLVKEYKRSRPGVPFTGKDVVFGIADWGFDFTHPNFLNPDGTTRFRYIWDQGTAYDGVNIYGFGTIHSREEINDALASDTPFQALNYHPGKNDLYHLGMHGTHVLDIAAGNGAVGTTGIAPEAELIAVHLATNISGDLMGLGTSVRVFDALHFLNSAAGNKPLVINMSVGSHGEAHTGLTLIEQAIDHLVTSRPNRAVVQSCGNYFASRIHTEGNLKEGEQVSFDWLISRQDNTPNEIEIWYERPDELQISLQAPDEAYLLQAEGVGRRNIQTRDGTETGRYYHRKMEPNTGLNLVLIILDENAGSGKWTIKLNGKKIRNGRYQAWIERDMGNLSNQSRFSLEQSTPSTTTGSICNGFYTIAVGAYDNRGKENKVALFSSAGPTWDGRQKPDMVTPGVGILAAKSASPYQSRSEGELTHKTGTSMAAPVVAGAVALMFEASGKPLRIQEIISRLRKACIIPASTNEIEKQQFGSGILQVEKLFAHDFSPEPVTAPKINHIQMDTFKPGYIPGESLLESYKEQFPELAEGNLAELFESLPYDRSTPIELSLQKGDLLIRRQYGHPEPVWYGVVEFVDGNEAWVLTPGKGRRKVYLPGRDWELRRVTIPDNYESIYNDEEATQFAEAGSAKGLGTCGQIKAGPDPVAGGKYKAAFTELNATFTISVPTVIIPPVIPIPQVTFIPFTIPLTKVRVYYPSDTTGRDQPFKKSLSKVPIVFMAHGNHATFYNPADRREEDISDHGGTYSPIPNYRGYEYLQENLARHGIISASIDCNATNQRGFITGNIELRAYYIMTAVESLQKENGSGKSIFYQKINFDKTGLFGHSRGGEAVLLIPDLINKLSSGVKIAGIISLAPTDNRRISTAPGDIPLMVVLPALDGDVVGNDGAKFYDRHRPTIFKTQLFVHRANHNNFNTEWTYNPDKAYDPGQPPDSYVPLPVDTVAEHQSLLSAYSCAFYRNVLLSEVNWLGTILGRMNPPTVSFSKVHISAERSKSYLLVDDFEDSNTAKNTLLGNNTLKDFVADERPLNQATTYIGKKSFFGDTKGIITAATASSGEIKLSLNKVYDLNKREIWLRAAEVYQGALPATAAEFSLGIEDKKGQSAFISVHHIGGVIRPVERRDPDRSRPIRNAAGDIINYKSFEIYSKTMMKTFVFAADCFQLQNTSLDLKEIVAIIIRNMNKTPVIYDQVMIY